MHHGWFGKNEIFYYNQFMAIKCPVCNADSIFEQQNSEVEVRRCPSCDHCFSDINSIKSLEEYSAEYYASTHQNWFRNPNFSLFEDIGRFISRNKPDAALIDVGCGKGDFLKYLRNKNIGISLTGIDITQNNPVEGVTFLQGDFLVTDFGAVYDVIVSLAVIEHMADCQMFIKRLYSLCAPNGFVVIMTVNDRSVLYGIARLLCKLGYKAPIERLYAKHHLNHFTVSSLRQLVRNNGFAVVKTLLHNAPLASMDFTAAASSLVAAILRAGVWGTFILGNFTGRTYLQTIICQKSK